jgi:ubiquinone biosynthesis protein
LNIESLSRQLAPELDIWTHAKPQVEKWLKKQVGFRAFLKRIRDNLPLWSEQLPEIPSLVYEVLRGIKTKQEKRRFASENEKI